MSVKVNNDGRYACIPDPDATVAVTFRARLASLMPTVTRNMLGDLPNSKHVWVRIAPGYGSDFCNAVLVSPSAQELAFLHIPAEDLFICTHNGLPCAGTLYGRMLSIPVRGPECIRGCGSNQSKSLGMLVLSALISAWKSPRNESVDALTGTILPSLIFLNRKRRGQESFVCLA